MLGHRYIRNVACIKHVSLSHLVLCFETLPKLVNNLENVEDTKVGRRTLEEELSCIMSQIDTVEQEYQVKLTIHTQVMDPSSLKEQQYVILTDFDFNISVGRLESWSFCFCPTFR